MLVQGKPFTCSRSRFHSTLNRNGVRYTKETYVKFFALIFLAVSLLGQSCVPAESLPPNGSQAGELTASSCQLSDSTKVSEYRLVLPVRGTLQIGAKATGFAPSFVIRDSDGRKVAAGTTLSRYMEAGKYLVLVNGSGLGKFTVTTAFVPEKNVLCTSFDRLGTGQSATGQLSPNSCKLPDGSMFDVWQTTVYGAGTLTITMRASSFDSFLLLRSEDGTLLASDDNGAGGRDAQITLAISGRETYSVVAATANASSKGGDYQISVSFTANPDETCRPLRALTESIQVTGSVSTASCNFNLPQRQDSSLFNIYSIHVAENGTAQISVPASTFTPLLLLLDKDGNPIVEDSGSGGLYTPLIRQPLTPGDYSVLVYNEDSFEGDYTLQYTFVGEPAQPCTVQTLDTSQSTSGALTGGASCRAQELLSDIYRLTLPVSSSVDIALASGDFTTFLELRDAKDNLLGMGDQTSEGRSAHFQADLPAGTYFLAAASVDLPGNYSLNAHTTPKVIPPCSASQNLAINTGFVATLGQGQCTGLAGEPVDSYKFTLAAEGTVGLVMTSADIDSFLTLLDPTGKVLRSDDNSYSQKDALIVQELKAGTYKVEARSRGGAGRYRVDLLWTANVKPPYCSASALKIGVAKSASLTYTGCQYYDNTFADMYQFTVTDPSRPVSVALNSAQFDSFLILTDSRGNVITTDDNSGGGSDALLSALLDTGTYFVVVKPADDPSQSGTYRLLIQQ
jgi:hypothetical protein